MAKVLRRYRVSKTTQQDTEPYTWNTKQNQEGNECRYNGLKHERLPKPINHDGYPPIRFDYS